ncbi:MAG: HAMP domain-containing histidine kinase [Chloroflexi bacterium]|uniref:HAMP domain-containing sensor histidine kinase n=1 Tax=Candidatus Flexifilum breve TaxID=3140694 RepID=UPI003135AFE1|nr:HAMP domain-containing histidine kinase [Chloroflexota bacterium]
MNSVTSTLVLVCLIAHIVVVGFLMIRRQRVRVGLPWLALTILFSALVAATLYPEFSSLALFMQALTLFTYGALSMRDMANRVPRLWTIFGVLWLFTLIGSVALLGNTPSWVLSAFAPPYPVSALFMLGGFALGGIILIASAFYKFYVARLPEVANRALFWGINSAYFMIGIFLVGTGANALGAPGSFVLLFGTLGAAYAQMNYRVLDIRRELTSTIRIMILLLITTLVIFGALIVADGIDANPTALVLALIALAAAILYLPIRQLAETLIGLTLRGSFKTDTTMIPRRYTQQIANAVELNALVEAATQALNELLRVRRSALILVNETGDTAELMLLPALLDRSGRASLTKSGSLYQHFAVEGSSLSQFDLEFNPRFKDLPEIAFFRESGLSAYAPILMDQTLIGVLACGAKLSDAPFTVHDFQLLTTMASQTGTVLRNARLVADLRKLNQGMQTLNSSLEDAKEQMERLDEVKTDFVTIASHELRTPLAQIRGYTDIMDALNEGGALEQDKMAGLVSNLRKATERMEELIAAMLDVSQLDVNAMNLHFTQTSLESVMRMAIEPLTDAIKQRKQTLAARGMRGLPIVQADLQRLVQAFRNIVVNAIKFTPDGGKIDITAMLEPAQAPGEQDYVLITIKDTGVGIEKENLELIFRKFYRAYDPGLHSTGTYKFMGAGPGLGLTIAQGVIEGHGGKIWAESPGHNMQTYPGTTFFIRLPVVPPEDARRVMPFQIPEAVSKDPTIVHTS